MNAHDNDTPQIDYKSRKDRIEDAKRQKREAKLARKRQKHKAA